MSAAAELALIREAYEALPNSTPQERTAWILERKRQLASDAPVSTRKLESNIKPYAEVADDPRVQRSQESE